MYEVNEPLVVHDTIDGEVLVIRNDTGTYYSLLGTGADLWTGVRAGLDDRGLVALLASRYDAAEADLVAAVEPFLATLLDAQLVRRATVGPTDVAPPPPVEAKLPFVAPSLEAYEDMADLLLFDPIHEVTPDGWPNVSGAGG